MYKLSSVAFFAALAFSCLADVRAQDGSINIDGYLRDVFHDPTDPDYFFLYLQVSNEFYYVAMPTKSTNAFSRMQSAIGAKLSVSGLLNPYTLTDKKPRLFSAHEIIPHAYNAKTITVLSPAPATPFEVPNEDSLANLTPNEVSIQSFRCIRGTVLAAWNGVNVLIKPKKGRVIEAELRDGPLPRIGETIDLVGLPETTLYNLRLNRAFWRSITPPADRTEIATSMNAKDIVFDGQGKSCVNMFQHGKLLRLKGVLRSIQVTESQTALLHIDDNGYVITVDASAAKHAIQNLHIGSLIEVTGICAIDVDIWRPNSVFPHIRGYTIITRTPADILILAQPPWLTPTRALVVVIILVAGLFGVLAWNWSLHTQSERRGHQLANEQILRAESDLKVHERTRLAVELHDALSQSLAGVALELKTVAVLSDSNPDLAKRHLLIADRSLLSCRDELRNCLYDLRSNALEEPSMDAAIRKTLSHHIDIKLLSIRFNVARNRISDNTAHAILCIIRELTLNAIRHGHASTIKIAGVIDNGKLCVSVRDNGNGFDPEHRPDVRQGHFGLQGIQERILSFNGTFLISSTPGEGTKASFTLNLPKDISING